MYVLLVLYADGIGAGGDVGENGTFNSPMFSSSCQLHSKLSWSFNKSLCLRMFSSSLVAMCWISSSMAGLEDQSSPPSFMILMPIGRLERA